MLAKAVQSLRYAQMHEPRSACKIIRERLVPTGIFDSKVMPMVKVQVGGEFHTCLMPACPSEEDLAEDGALERLELKAAAELKPYGAFCSHVNLCGALEN